MMSSESVSKETKIEVRYKNFTFSFQRTEQSRNLFKKSHALLLENQFCALFRAKKLNFWHKRYNRPEYEESRSVPVSLRALFDI